MKFPVRHPAWFVTCAAALILLLELFYIPGGSVDIESPGFLLHYNMSRPFWETIFDPYRNDWGLYQARELSYLFDWFDARLIGSGIRHGIVFFHSATAWCMLVAVVGLQQYGLRTLFPEMKSRVTTLLSLWFILLPCCTNNSFFRSSKYGCALVFTAVALLSWSLLIRHDECVEKRRIAVIAVLLVIAGLFDRQGAFFTAAYTGGAGLLLFLLQLAKSKRFGGFCVAWNDLKLLRMLTLGGLAATLFGMLYNLWLAPYLIFRLNGYFPSFSFQNLGRLPWFEILPEGCRFISANTGFALTGMLSSVAGFLLLAGIAAAFFLCWYRTRDERSLLAGVVFLLVWAAMCLAATAMTGRHPPLRLPQVMTGVYFLPAWALLIVFAGGAADALRRVGIHLPVLEIFASVAIAIHLLMTVLPQAFPYGRLQRPELPQEVHLLRRALKDPSYDYSRDLLYPRTERLIEFFRAGNDRPASCSAEKSEP